MDILNSVIDGITSNIKGPKDVAIMVILLVIIILSYVLNYYKPEIKGYLGEKRVFKLLSKLPEDKYSILHNIMLKTKKGTTQIDYVVVSCYGLFIIEVKNYTGWITGSEYKKEWTQTIYKVKNKFMNPFHQNYGHVKNIQGLLNDETIPVYSIVAFSDDAEIKFDIKKNTLVYWSELYDTILEMSKKEVMNKDKMREIVKLINENNIDSPEARKEHIENINNNYY